MESDIKNALSNHFQQLPSSPFLFVGSGFSRRYIGLEGWEELLRLFCKKLDKPYKYYVSISDGTLQDVATQMSPDFNNMWWSSPDFKEERELYTNHISGQSSALKISIANYIKTLTVDEISDSMLKTEIDLLTNSNIDGIITTNWDIFLEHLFPEYKVYVGQEELISSSPLSIAEIYKIHGCVSSPNSLVLNSSDYEEFNKKNAYLAAKLITLFIEHPIIFIGYSLSDSNIVDLLNSIVNCLTESGLEKLKNNLIFVQRLKPGRVEGISDTIMALDGVNLPIKSVTTSSFVPVYEAIGTIERKIPANILRHCKDQFYTLIKDNDPNGQLSVIDYDNIENYDDIQFFAGIGVSDIVSNLGYRSIKADDMFFDWFDGSGNFDSDQIIANTIPQLKPGRSYLPIYKYLHDSGICSYSDYVASDLDFESLLAQNHEKYQTSQKKRSYELHAQNKTLAQIIDEFDADKACTYIPFLPTDQINIDVLVEFLDANRHLIEHNTHKTYYRKMICLADYLKYGWPTTAA
ncbi:SIR2 family protein [Methanolobus sp. WCC4]|uniref:SIR2 family protein n=1 Tax=Methanolobus sp. WCC4 TaxID=3125784 RepID=UPI0030F92EDD